jgi:transcription antitermination factor NusG
MDFFQFLQNSKDTPNSKTINKTQTRKIQETETPNTPLTLTPTNLANEEVEVYKNITKGDMVKIMGVKGSILNSYKGYIGEVKDYKRDKDSAMIFLHAITYPTVIKFPLHHFVKIDPYKGE